MQWKKRDHEEKHLSSTRKAPLTRSIGARKPLVKRGSRREKVEADIVRHTKFIQSNAPHSEALLQKLRARIKAAEDMREQNQQMPSPSRNAVCDERRPTKSRRIDEACADGPKLHVGTGICKEGPTRSIFTKKLHKQIEAQLSKKVTMHDIKNSKCRSAKATIRHKYVDHGTGGEQRILQGSTSSSKMGRTSIENEAIGRLLNPKSR